MKLSIKSTKKIENFYIKDLNDKIFNIELDKEQNIPEGWYELTVPYSGEKIEIQDILINDETIRYLIYTGFYTDGNGIIHQPANAVWDENGKYTIWIHTQLGVLWQRLVDNIRGGDFGTNLFEKYVRTVDKNIIIKENFSNTLKSYFANGYGPNWWIKNDRFTPYISLKANENDILNTDKDQLLLELKKCMPFAEERVGGIRGWDKSSLKEGCSANLPFVELSDLPSVFVQNFIKKIGFKRVIDMAIQTLDGNTGISIHRDDHFRRECYPWTSGAVKFYWNITDSENIYFKLGMAGLIPLEKPLFINTVEHVHTVINQSDKKRTVIHMYGEL